MKSDIFYAAWRSLARSIGNSVDHALNFLEAASDGQSSPSDLVILDNRYPVLFEGRPGGRRNTENDAILRALPAAKVLVPPNRYPFMGTRARDAIEEAKRVFLAQTPDIQPTQIDYVNPTKPINAKLAYMVFQNVVINQLPYLERHNVPFIFAVYPGGGFAMGAVGDVSALPAQNKSDDVLRRISRSPCFRKVFVHHRIIFNHLIENGIFTKDQIAFVRGGHVQIKKDEVEPKTYFGFDRDKLNICFVAHRYSETGECKGYDVFVKTARMLLAKNDAYRFHVVGDWNESIIEIEDIKDKFNFYGTRPKEFFPKFYSEMDIILSPTRANYPSRGKFDGFPLVTDAGYCGVAMFVSDPMNQNEDYVIGKNIEIIPRLSRAISAKIMHYYQHPEQLKALAIGGQAITQVIRDGESHLKAKIEVLKACIADEKARRSASK